MVGFTNQFYLHKFLIMPDDLILDVTVKVVARPRDVINTPHSRNQWTTFARLASNVYIDKTTVDNAAIVAARIAAFIQAAGLLLPTATVQTPTPVADTTATFKGLVDPQNVSTVVTFLSGTTPDVLDNEDAAAESPVAGVSPVAVSFAETGLTAETTYYYRVKAVSATGTTISDPIEFTTTA
jgi:hypothetical protein